MKYIKTIVEPNSLVLCWIPPEGSYRRRYRVGKIRKISDIQYEFRYLTEIEDFSIARNNGFQLYPSFKKENEIYTEGVLEAFIKRLPPRSRRDFSKYLNLFRINQNLVFSDYALLGYTGAKLPTDGFSLVHTFEGYSGDCDFLIEIAGFRYQKEVDINDIELDSKVEFVQKNMDEDANAVEIILGGKLIGYVNRCLNERFREWLCGGYKITGNIEKINGHHARPLIYVYVSVSRVD